MQHLKVLSDLFLVWKNRCDFVSSIGVSVMCALWLLFPSVMWYTSPNQHFLTQSFKNKPKWQKHYINNTSEIQCCLMTVVRITSLWWLFLSVLPILDFISLINQNLWGYYVCSLLVCTPCNLTGFSCQMLLLPHPPQQPETRFGVRQILWLPKNIDIAIRTGP